MKAPGVLALALVLMCPAAASADWFITPFIGLKFAGDTNLVDLESGASNTKLTLGGIQLDDRRRRAGLRGRRRIFAPILRAFERRSWSPAAT